MQTAIVTIMIEHPTLGKVQVTAEVKAVWNSPERTLDYETDGYFDDVECIDIDEVIAIRGDEQIPINPKHWFKYTNDLYDLVEAEESTKEFQDEVKDYAANNWVY